MLILNKNLVLNNRNSEYDQSVADIKQNTPSKQV
jgi:hypothetical protein